MKNPKNLLLALLLLIGAAVALDLAPAFADPPLDNCAAVLCLRCPEGTVAAPTPGNCCRCVPAK
jgi:hypothetical protein